MKKDDFIKDISRLTAMFEVESRSHTDIKILFDEYYRTLGKSDYLIFKKAIDVLIELHPTRKMPTVREIMQAISDVKADIPKEQHYEDECKKCLGMGVWIDPEDQLAKACHCYKGSIYLAARKEDDTKRHHQRKKRTIF